MMQLPHRTATATESTAAEVASPVEPPVGSVVYYDHPSWGPAWGEVLRVADNQVLVQDRHPDGAREWWPLAGVRPEGR